MLLACFTVVSGRSLAKSDVHCFLKLMYVMHMLYNQIDVF